MFQWTQLSFAVVELLFFQKLIKTFNETAKKINKIVGKRKKMTVERFKNESLSYVVIKLQIDS